MRSDLALPLARDWDLVRDDSRGVEWTTWFTDARLSVAEACVHRWAREQPDDEAAVLRSKAAIGVVTWSELSREVTRLAEALASLGIGGDAVGIFLPMAPEAAIASHACAHLGAVQVPIFSGFAAPAIASRLADAGARALVTADGSLRRRRAADEGDRGRGARERAHRRARRRPAQARARRADDAGPRPRLGRARRRRAGHTAGARGRERGAVPPRVHLGHDRPAEGRAPRAGGFLVSIAREAAYQADIRAGDRVLFATDMGWIMGPWTVVGAGALGATIVFMEGAPDWPADRSGTSSSRSG